MSLVSNLIAAITGRRPPSGGETTTATFQPYAPNFQLKFPTYLEHMDDVSRRREQTDSRDLLKELFKQDPDISAAVHAYLTLGDTEMISWASDLDGNIDRDATNKVHRLLNRLTRQIDYTQGFTFKESMKQLNANMRYMLLLRGGIASELVLTADRQPDSVRLIDSASLRWFEPAPGQYKPGQLVLGKPLPILLDIPTFRVSFYRRDPTSIYSYSDFVSAINTVAARTQVINDLYRIMRVTGFPRIDISIMENVITDSAPLDIKSDQEKLRSYVRARMTELGKTFENIRADQALTHSDAVQIKILNERSSGVAVDVTPVIETLNAQNQAALKTMATVIGRGASGANTGSVEARMAALYSDQINVPLQETWEGHLSYALHQQGFQGWVNVRFRPAELRPDTELEPQRVMKSQRLRLDLSDGIITDAEYTMEMYGRLPNPEAEKLSGTGFLSEVPGGAQEGLNPADISPNADPLGRSAAPDQTKMTKQNQPKSKTTKSKK